MDGSDRARRLFWHGMVLVVAGLLMGAVVQSVANPRMGLSAHVGTIMNGTLVVAVGALWPRLALSPRLVSVAFWLVVDGSYLNCAGVFLAAVLGTGISTPLHGAGHAAAPWQEALVGAALTVGAVAVLAGAAIVVWGLRRRAG